MSMLNTVAVSTDPDYVGEGTSQLHVPSDELAARSPGKITLERVYPQACTVPNSTCVGYVGCT